MRNSLWIYLTLLFILIFDIWVENSNQAKSLFGNFIEPVTDKPQFSIVWTVLIVIGLIVAHINQRRRLEDEKKELEEKLESEMDILIMANQELSKYRLQDTLSSILANFVARHPYVLAVQTYWYEEKNIQGNTMLRLNFNNGYVAPGVNVNSIQQLIYHCDIEKLREFRIAKSNFEKDGSSFMLVSFIINTYEELKNKKEEDFTEEDTILCSLMFLSLEIIEKEFNLVRTNFIEEDHEEKLNKLIDLNRTGLIRGAIVGDGFYSFTHTRENQKLNRQYLARLVELRKQKTLFSIVLDSSILNDEYDDILNYLAEDFIELLNELEIMYNNIKKG
ncbi:hypothetical protein [Virgibacillus halodenitrificans]|uniref:hypothetical protein n=1 Tax=Virgibacillus halodenitrificans TaxID=1482 RepID=UPI000EF51DDF|nr:hypothetical protein [Virgibacillus halodenitrificans]